MSATDSSPTISPSQSWIPSWVWERHALKSSQSYALLTLKVTGPSMQNLRCWTSEQYASPMLAQGITANGVLSGGSKSWTSNPVLQKLQLDLESGTIWGNNDNKNDHGNEHNHNLEHNQQRHEKQRSPLTIVSFTMYYQTAATTTSTTTTTTAVSTTTTVTTTAAATTTATASATEYCSCCWRFCFEYYNYQVHPSYLSWSLYACDVIAKRGPSILFKSSTNLGCRSDPNWEHPWLFGTT